MSEEEPEEIRQDLETQPLLLVDNHNPNQALGLFYAALSAFIFSIMSLFVKFSGETFPTSEIVFIRSIIQWLLAVATSYFLNVNPFGPPEVNKWLLLARGTSGALSLACYFYTLTHMPLGDGTSIFFISPAFVAISARIFLGEVFSFIDMIGTGLCLIGVVMVSRPEFLFGKGNHDYPYTVNPMIPAIVALVGAFISSFAYCIVRIVGKRVHFMVHVHYFGLVSSAFSGIAMLYEKPKTMSNIQDILCLIAIGLTAFTAQGFLNASLQKASAGPVALMRNLDILFAFLLGTLYFSEIPQWNSFVGAALIGATTGSIAYYKWKYPTK
jgi:drug/metabolite transporter (DMT)-like permease